MGDSANSLRSTFSPLPDPPIALTASVFALVLTVTFDRALQPGAVDFGNWRARNTNVMFPASAAVIGGPGNTQAIVALMGPGVPDFGGNRCWYEPPPFDVVGHPDAVPVAGFTLPLT